MKLPTRPDWWPAWLLWNKPTLVVLAFIVLIVLIVLFGGEGTA